MYQQDFTPFLLPNETEKRPLLYDLNPYPYLLPQHGITPPYYCNPRYTPYYPLI